MRRVLIFGGTTEGRIEAETAVRRGEQVMVSVTSDYARQFLPEGVECHVGILDKDTMTDFMRRLDPELVVDATHPFAVRATETIRVCASELGIRYKRSLRPADQVNAWHDAVIWVDTAEEAASRLSETDGNVLLTTGSNTVAIYAQMVDHDRLYVRVLPTLSAIQKCMDAGISSGHIIAMQGPFTERMNGAFYDQLKISVMVSKDSGDPGGVTDKVLPALEAGITVIMIRRPKEYDNHAR